MPTPPGPGLGSGALHQVQFTFPSLTIFFFTFYFVLLLTFFLTFFNQWLRLEVAFCNYQSQPLITIAPGAIP